MTETVKIFDPTTVANKAQVVSLTPAALQYFIKTLPAGVLGLRVDLKEAGCSGLKYVLAPAFEPQAGDQLFPITEEFTVFINAKNIPSLYGLQIDCVTEGINKVVKFNNPNEKGSCGCGESFSV